MKTGKQNKVHVKKGDLVQIISGKDKDFVEEVIEVFPKENRVRVRNANIVTKHQKPTQQNQAGGRIEVEGKIDASNVLLYCPTCQKGVRYKKVVDENGRKQRVCRKCGEVLDRESEV